MIQKYWNGTVYTPTLSNYCFERGRLIGCTDTSILQTIVRDAERLLDQGDYWSLDAVLNVLEVLSTDSPACGYELQRGIEKVYEKATKGERLYIFGVPDTND